jgi:glycosyltransferase involved in cell wall biosynthesis
LLVGPTSPGFDLDRRLQRLGLDAEGLVHEDWVDETRLWALMSGVDVCVNLRHPTMGETSGSVIRSLSLGRPLVVSDVGWFSELPSDVALKIPVGAGEVEALTAGLELLLTRDGLREQMGKAAAALAVREHDLGLVAERYAAAVEEAAGGGAVADAVLREVSKAAADVGIDPDAAEAGEIARRLAEVELGR